LPDLLVACAWHAAWQEEPFTAKIAKEIRKGRKKEERNHWFALRSSRIFFAIFAVKSFSCLLDNFAPAFPTLLRPKMRQ
jgi:hypothetical protein